MASILSGQTAQDVEVACVVVIRQILNRAGACTFRPLGVSQARLQLRTSPSVLVLRKRMEGNRHEVSGTPFRRSSEGRA